MGLLLSLGALLLAIGWYEHHHSRAYLEQASYVNPLIRDRQVNFFGYQPYTAREQLIYERLNDLDSLRKMELYEETVVTLPIVYLGEGPSSHYFQDQDGQQLRYSQMLTYNDSIDQAQIVGSRFHLKDEAFESIGFKNPQNIMFESIEVPSSQKGQIYTPKSGHDVLNLQEVINGWNF